MKALLYSPSASVNDENAFFESMEAAASLGGDILVFPENIYTPYNELLCSVDILSGEEYEAVLDCLYDFCGELGYAAVFNAADDFGFGYSIFVNPMAHKGETFNKLYLKHTCAKLTCFELEDYDKCICELFEPIIYRGRKIGLSIGEDIFLPHIFNRYGSGKVDLVINSFSQDAGNISAAAEKISVWKNQVVLAAGHNGSCFGTAPANGMISARNEGFGLYSVDFDNRHYASKPGSKPEFAETEKYVGKNADKYALLQK
ncbi:MAG: hypothetical protein IJ460_00970 [Clostridia bacterium]|nr:hypothetical protein [Clostridia bacterium]